ncbi:MAG: type II toxin-antitoxin system RelE/ParE family toxin [Geminicoccaceae bacterium]|nr:type II toxin-antitoxin system RelE/ParE family toxin [Geminicoccaceae bacterium]
MKHYRLRPEAVADLESIGDYIAADNPTRAVSFVRELIAVCQRLAATPGIGVARESLRAGLRMFPVRGYLIFYVPTDDGVEVIRVLSGARDIDALF